MFFEQKYRIRVCDTISSTKVSNTGFLGLMEDVGGLHSSEVGFGIYDIPKTNLTWLLLEWRLQVISRPQIEQWVYVKTWSRKIEKYYAYRDFEVHDENGKLLAIATSKWILINTEKRKVTKVDDYINECYETEDDRVFGEDEKLDKLKEPENAENVLEYDIARRDIDLYNHMHNLYYLDLAYEALPEDVYKKAHKFNNIRITYKKEVKYGAKIKCMYKRQDDEHIIAIKNKDDNTLHAIVKMW